MKQKTTQSQAMYLPATILSLEPLDWDDFRPRLIKNFRVALDSAKDERPLQEFFEKHPIALVTEKIGDHGTWVIPKPRLPLPQKGGGVPDFLICEWTSLGMSWTIVELESPNEAPLKKKGISAKCNEARDQIEQYRTYISKNSAFLRDNGFPSVHGMCEGIIIIGRRKDRNHEKTELLQSFKRAGIEVMSYDRLLEQAQDFQKMLRAWAAQRKRIRR